MNRRGQILTGRRLTFMGVTVLLASLSINTQAQRSTTLKLIPGSVELRNVVYAAGTSPDLTKPAAGSGELAVIIGGKSFSKSGVTFTNLISDGSSNLAGLNFTLDRPFEFDPGVGLKLALPAGQANVLASRKITFSGKAVVSTPYRSRNGDSIQLEVGGFEGSGTEQQGELLLRGMTLKGAAISEGIQLPGVKVTSSAFDLKLAWNPQKITSWLLTVPQGTVDATIPGVATSPQYPLSASVVNLTLDHAGKVNCTEVSITNRSEINFPEIAGFKARVKGGKLTIRDSKPSVSNLRVDVTLPPGLLKDDDPTNSGNPPGGGNRPNNPNQPPVSIPDGPNVIVKVENGVTIEFPDPIAFKVAKTKLTARKVFIDLSTSLFGAGSPPKAADPKWKGIWLPSGKVIPPVGAGAPQLDYTNFLVESSGLSGSVLANNLNFKAESFDIKNASIGLTFSQNVLTAGEVSGTVSIPGLGNLPCAAEFSEDGDTRFAVTNGSLNLPDIGMKLEKINAQLDPTGLVVGGELTFVERFVQQRASQGMPQNLAGAKFGIQGMRIAADGAITMPQEGGITLPNPVRLDVGPCTVEIRGVSFTATGNNIDSITFSGSAGLNKAIEGLPASGELDFEGFKIAKEGNDSKFSMGGFGFKAEIPQLGTVSASLYRQNLPTFGDTLYGDAELRLACLGNMASGIGLEFLLAPKNGAEPAAWFIGGSVEVPPILVQAPASPPIPLFNINGFSGGFGMNVVPKYPGVGRISQPNLELEYSKGTVLAQVGLLLSDPASAGRVWWADSALTFTFNPVIIDLTARMVFLDLDGAKFLDADEWRQKDRIARVYMAFDSRGPSFVVGGDADLNFPSRSLNLFSVSGSAELLMSPNDKHLYVGWPDGGQKPVQVRFAKAVKDYVDIDAKFGMGLVFAQRGNQLSTSGGMFLDANAKFKIPGAEVRGGFYGNLAFAGLGTSSFSASGLVRLDAKVDFGVFTAMAEADLMITLKDDFRIQGDVTGLAGPFSATVPILLIFKN